MVGNQALKIGSHVELEGPTYRIKGMVSGIQLEGFDDEATVLAALALLVPAAVQAQGLDSLLSGMEAANEDKLNPVAEHPPLIAPPFLAPVGLPLQQARTVCPALQKAVVAATGAESGVWSITVANRDGMVLADLHGNKSQFQPRTKN